MPGFRRITFLLAVVLAPVLASHSDRFQVSAQESAPMASTSIAEGTNAAARQDLVKVETFEQLPAGSFEVIESELGTWRQIRGIVSIDDQHAKTGQQSLWLQGGEETVLEWELGEHVDPAGDLRFWAERWTVRQPFEFRIEKQVGDAWEEIYNGDREVRVGRSFLSRVNVPLRDARIKRLRFTVSSPAETGLLIDDLALMPLTNQSLESLTIEPIVIPALVGVDASPLLKIKIETSGQLNPLQLKRLHLAWDETVDRRDVQSVHIRYGATGGVADAKPIGIETSEIDQSSFHIDLSEPLELSEGTSFLWVSCQVAAHANLDRAIQLHCHEVDLSDGSTPRPVGESNAQRLGIALRQGGDDAVHTYRIPGLVTTKQGTLITVYDVRRRGGGDLPADIDIGMSRSTDGGRSWEAMRIVMDQGSDPQWRYDGVGDPAILVDQTTGTIWIAGLWSHGNRGWHGSGAGLAPEETGQFLLVKSDDDGLTWSAPINITSQVKDPSWSLLLQGPGKGITMDDGTLVFAAQFQASQQEQRVPSSTIIYSRDHGQSWQCGSAAHPETTEAQVVELESGVLMLNCRYNLASARVVMITRDLGMTWQKHETNQKDLIEPGACMASLINVDRELQLGDASRLLFSNPDSLTRRERLTIKGSRDQGNHWPQEARLLLDEGVSAGYSCLTMIDPNTVGILYEGSQSHLTFQRIRLSEIFGENADPN